ncbi:hypothetical protein TUM17377_06980 [Shewanella chilikensis]|nr:hypothetical protein TUM17377_06980 [Shewanella chilikensis]
MLKRHSKYNQNDTIKNTQKSKTLIKNKNKTWHISCSMKENLSNRLCQRDANEQTKIHPDRTVTCVGRFFHCTSQYRQ